MAVIRGFATRIAMRRWLVERARAGFNAARWAVAIGALTVVADACSTHVPPTTSPASKPSTASSFTATAYCTGKVTATGTRPANGIVAADPAVLRMGSRIRLTGLGQPYDGVYTVRDTGSSVRGHRVDLSMRDCREAVRFGRRSAVVAVLR